MNPGGSIKDRAALNMVQEALASGDLKPGMTLVEGTAGNTGIGLAIVAKEKGFREGFQIALRRVKEMEH